MTRGQERTPLEARRTTSVVAGASGFIGRRLVAHLRERGDDVVTVGRSGADVSWGDEERLIEALEGADLLVNLAGKSVNCRYTAANRTEIVRSRVETTRQLGAAIAACDDPPALWINASTATIYRHSEDRAMGEHTGELGEGFSVEVARAWEAAFLEQRLPATRRVALRIAIVLGDGGVLVPLARLVRLGLGGPQIDGRWPASRSRRRAGTYHQYGAPGGRQRFSWVHVDDVLGVIDFVREHRELDGVVNVSAPHPTDNRTLMRTLRRVLGAPFGLPAYRWMLEIGSAVIRTETELVLKSRWVVPDRLEAAGYRFGFPDLEPALRSILRPASGERTR